MSARSFTEGPDGRLLCGDERCMARHDHGGAGAPSPEEMAEREPRTSVWMSLVRMGERERWACVLDSGEQRVWNQKMPGDTNGDYWTTATETQAAFIADALVRDLVAERARAGAHEAKLAAEVAALRKRSEAVDDATTAFFRNFKPSDEATRDRMLAVFRALTSP